MTHERRLAIVALILAAGAAVVGSPFSGGRAVGAVELQALARAASAGEDRVSSFELARWIRDGGAADRTLRVVDLRSREAFEDFTLPRGEWIPLDSLVRTPPDPETRLVLVSADGALAAQAWVLAQLAGHRNAWVLEGGALGWIREVLTPVVPAVLPDAERELWEELIELTRYYGGEPRRAEDPDEPIPAPAAPRDPDALVELLVQEGRDRGCGW